MANDEHLKILKQGVEAWNYWITKNPSTQPDFREADLRGFRCGSVTKGNVTTGLTLRDANFNNYLIT